MIKVLIEVEFSQQALSRVEYKKNSFRTETASDIN